MAPFLEIDGGERSPRRRDGREAVGIVEADLAVERVLQSRRAMGLSERTASRCRRRRTARWRDESRSASRRMQACARRPGVPSPRSRPRCAARRCRRATGTPAGCPSGPRDDMPRSTSEYSALPFVGLPSGSFRSASFTRHVISLALTYISPEFGSNATPPHSPPPSMPGKRTVPCALGGSNSPRLAELQPLLAHGLLGCGRPLRDQVLGELLPREGRRQRGQHLRRRRPARRDVGGRRP